MNSAVVTVVHGRHDHLRAQRRGLAAAQVRPALHVVVAIDDPAIAEVVRDGTGLPTAVLPWPAPAAAGGRLPPGAELLIFRAVAGIPAPALTSHYLAAARAFPGSLLSGPVT